MVRVRRYLKKTRTIPVSQKIVNVVSFLIMFNLHTKILHVKYILVYMCGFAYNYNIYWISFNIGNSLIYIYTTSHCLLLLFSLSLPERLGKRGSPWLYLSWFSPWILFLSSLKASFSKFLFQAPIYIFWKHPDSVQGLNSVLGSILRPIHQRVCLLLKDNMHLLLTLAFTSEPDHA